MPSLIVVPPNLVILTSTPAIALLLPSLLQIIGHPYDLYIFPLFKRLFIIILSETDREWL